jgi:hypothetical protein
MWREIGWGERVGMVLWYLLAAGLMFCMTAVVLTTPGI